MPSAWESESGKDECWSDREAWRGELHLDGSDSWRREAGEGWVWAGMVSPFGVSARTPCANHPRTRHRRV